MEGSFGHLFSLSSAILEADDPSSLQREGIFFGAAFSWQREYTFGLCDPCGIIRLLVSQLFMFIIF
jgi:hypothetical protein